MKLAEALQERADLNERIRLLSQRLNSNSIVQEGESPAEEPSELLTELNSSISRMQELICAINRTNCSTVTEGRTITELIAERDCLKKKLECLRSLVYEASQTGRRARNTEIKLVSTVDVKALNSEINELSRQLRLVDNTIQAANWSTELILK